MDDTASDLARRLADHAEAVCRHYLSNGRRAGRYWVVGDVANTPGRSLYVRLFETADGRIAGKWTDAATGEHGDLLDLIVLRLGFSHLWEAMDEARRFLGGAAPSPMTDPPSAPLPAKDRSAASRRLFAMSGPIKGTIAERYLAARGIVDLSGCGWLRFHPRCWRRPDEGEPPGQNALPALIAAVTDLDRRICGLQRTWLDRVICGKADVATPRRAMGHLIGNAVRFGEADDVWLAGEGAETVLSLRQALPRLPMAAGLSANHLAAVEFPRTLRRLYIAQDADTAGRIAAERLAQRAEVAGISWRLLNPKLEDFNEDLRRDGLHALFASLKVQLDPEDITRFATPQLA